MWWLLTCQVITFYSEVWDDSIIITLHFSFSFIYFRSISNHEFIEKNTNLLNNTWFDSNLCFVTKTIRLVGLLWRQLENEHIHWLKNQHDQKIRNEKSYFPEKWWEFKLVGKVCLPSSQKNRNTVQMCRHTRTTCTLVVVCVCLLCSVGRFDDRSDSIKCVKSVVQRWFTVSIVSPDQDCVSICSFDIGHNKWYAPFCVNTHIVSQNQQFSTWTKLSLFVFVHCFDVCTDSKQIANW